MEIRVLGPVEVSAGGRPVAIGAGKPRALLALLALHEGSALSTDRLVEALWGEDPPATAGKMVQLAVSQLRKALANGEGGAQIVTRGRGYELRLGDGGLDVRRVERLIARGLPREALALWRGAPLADVADEPFAAVEVRRLEELRIGALELAIEGDLAAGRYREVLGELESLVADEPLREGLHAQRMRALYRSGRQAEALDAYRDARHALVEAIGVEPGPELRRLHEAILRHDPELDPPADEMAALPPELYAGVALVGRGAELDALREQWRQAHGGAGRLVLVAGARGIGKTRLAAELASEVHRDRGAVLYASGVGPPTATHAALQSAAAARRPTLLVLDDLDRASDELRTELGGLVDQLGGLSVLVVALAEDGRVVAELDADARLTLGPLDADGVAAIARVYASAGTDVESTVARLVAESGGVPQAVHRAAGEWARTEAARALNVAARHAASERAGLRAAEDELAGNVVELQAARERARPPPDDADGVVVCPFKGLASFDVDDAGFFFGRERLVAEMVARLAGAPLMGIVGPSGSGKSSALRAGLLPALAAGVLPGSEGWALALLRPGEHPIRALEEATAQAAARGRLVVAVDQFEELFTACRDERDRAAFVDALVAAARDPSRRALVLVAVRADFYGRCAAYPELWRLLGANQVPVGPMRRDELRRAIELPAHRAGLQIERDLTDALTADVDGQPGALPLLSTSLLELWQHRDGRRLRLAAYEQAGGVHGAVARLAEGAYERLDATQRHVARAIMLRLAGEGGEAAVRARVGLEEFGEEARPVVAALTDSRLLTVSEGEVEVAHEALLHEWPRLRGWLEDDAEGRRLHANLRVAAKEWEARGRDHADLYRGARLASAVDWATEHDPELNATEHAFLDAGRTASGRAHRRLRMVLAGVAALLVIAVIAGVVALDQRGNARDQALAADAQRLGTRALVEDDLDRSLLLARQGFELGSSAQTRGNLLAALVRSPAAIGVIRGGGDPLSAMALSGDERTLAVGNTRDKVSLFDTRTHRRLRVLDPTPKGGSYVTKVAFDADASRVAVAYDRQAGNALAVFDTRSGRIVSRLALPDDRLVTGLRYTPDGRTIEVVGSVFPDEKPGPAALYRFDARTGRRTRDPVELNRVGLSPLMVTSDGRRFVAAGDDEITIRDARGLRALRHIGLSGLPRSSAVALSPDDHTVALGGEDEGSVRLLDLRSGDVRVASGRHDGAVDSAQFTPDGRWLVTTGDDGDVILWDVRKAAAAETLSGHGGAVSASSITHDGATLYTSSADGTVIVWDLLGTRRLGRPFKAGADNDGAFPRYAMSSDGRAIAHGQADGAISIVDARTLARRRPFPVVPMGPVLGMGFVPGSHLLVVGGQSGFLALVDPDTERVVKRLPGHRATCPLEQPEMRCRIWTPGISADGRLMVTGSTDQTVRFWSLPDGRAIEAPLRFAQVVNDVQLSPDGRWVSVALVDDDLGTTAVEIWDAHTRRRVHRVRSTALIDVTRFSPDGRLLAVGSPQGTELWSTATWRPVTRTFVGSGNPAISRDGRTLATAVDGTVRLWDIASQQAVGAPLPGLPNRNVVSFFSPDGSRLFAGYDTGRAYRWDIRPESLARHACKVAGRRLTRAEWAEFLPTRDYAPAC
jgi:WD40 repeat protein/DNA-binding SARP family transcriptional activator